MPAQPEPLNTPRKLPAKELEGPGTEPLDVVEFRDLTLQDAMRLLSQQTGLKIVPSEDAGKKKTSLYLPNVSAIQAVEEVCSATGLIYRRDDQTGIIRIFSSKENQRDLASFRKEATEVFTLLYPNATNVATAIRDLFGTRVQLSYGTNDQRIIQDLQQRFNRFDLLNSRSLGIGLPSNGGFGGGGIGGGGGFGGGGFGGGGGGFGGGGFGGGGGIGGGGGFGGGGFGGGGFGGGGGGFGGGNATGQFANQQVGQNQQLRDDNKPGQRLPDLTPEEIQQLEKAFTGKDIADRALLLELLSRQPANIYVTVVKEHNQLIVRTSDEDKLKQIRELVYRLDVPTPVVLLEVKVLQINLNDTFTSIFDYQFTDGILNAGGFTSGNILPPAADALSSALRRQSTIAPGPLGTMPPQDLTFQVVERQFPLPHAVARDRQPRDLNGHAAAHDRQ